MAFKRLKFKLDAPFVLASTQAWSVCVRLSRHDKFELEFLEEVLNITKFGEAGVAISQRDQEGDNLKSIFDSGSFL